MEILSLQNARVKSWTQLQEKKHRDKQNKFVVEGIHLVQEALISGADIECIAYDYDQGIPHELKELPDNGQGVEWIGVTEAIISKVSHTSTPQPVFAVVRKEKMTWDDLFAQKDKLVIVLDGLQDPGNVGTIIRSADASGVGGVILGKGCADLYNPKTLRSTMGSLFHLPVIEGELTDILPQAREMGARLVTTSLEGQTTAFHYDFGGSCWIVIGSEGSGVSPEVSALVDDAIIIPMPGKAESLNAAMAASVLMFEALRQREYSN
ncbi:RNA methyltransferase, TrmH family [Paenibacillus uliginis N3/975]|uniref:RNA methyltransferase, TrmH family n=1 Tax=Paenibacillus uliginis N3/975 TaxID=1313296 RepID=A0A1X7GL51_9BACL|nr:RNA methyltransferase [Paenibacillus uliginis]SMF71467.1 RNA methyltransferase, TrmH family [Paenibacillus uliginis N3/975]